MHGHIPEHTVIETAGDVEAAMYGESGVQAGLYRTFSVARLRLEVVDEDARGFVVAHRPPARGAPDADGAEGVCGACGRLVAVGLAPGTLSHLLFACRCGALNRIPQLSGGAGPSPA